MPRAPKIKIHTFINTRGYISLNNTSINLDKDIDYEISFTDYVKPEKIADENGEVVIYKNENVFGGR